MERCIPKNVCVVYFFTTILVTAVVYFITISHLQSTVLISKLTEDVEQISRLVQNNEYEKSYGHGKRTELTTCTEIAERVFKRLISEMQTELIRTQQLVEQLRIQGGKDKCKQDVKSFSGEESGLMNFAEQSLGARIEFVNDEPINESNFIYKWMGIERLSNPPQSALNPSINPGNCYGYRGVNSILIIKLSQRIFIDSVMLYHNFVPVGERGVSAPKDFSVYGLDCSKNNEFLLGTFQYQLNFNEPKQLFTMQTASPRPYACAKFNFYSNHGNPNWTCIYRIGVYGRISGNTNHALNI